MKIAIVGANGQVGTELCFILDGKNREVIPIIRNELGAAFLTHHKFNCRIADISREDDAKNTLNDCDVVVISAYMWPNMNISAEQNIEINENLVKNSIINSKENATVIYFSTIRTLSKKIDKKTPRLSPLPAYDNEKLNLEDLFKDICIL